MTKMTKKRLRKRKMTGARRATLFLFSVLMLMLVFSVAGFAAEKKEKKQESYSIVAGTVFRPPGFALAGAEVTLKPEKGSAQKAVANGRGEFAFRVPSKFASYTVKVKATGFEAQEKITEIGIDQRIDLAFELIPARKK